MLTPAELPACSFLPRREMRCFGCIRELIMRKILNRFVKQESGATAIEYGLIAGLIAVVIITAVTAIGTNLSGTFTTISTSLK